MNTENNIVQAINGLASAVGKWGNYNFDYHAPYVGAAEEAGELLHAKLKAAQNIRGTQEEHRAAIVDAYADMCVFLAHLKHKLNTREKMDDFPDRVDYGHLLMSLGHLLVDPTNEHNFVRVVNQLVHCANLDDVDLVRELKSTWSEVCKRDWRQFPKNGKTE